MIVIWIFEDLRLIFIIFLNILIVVNLLIGFLEFILFVGLICWCVKVFLVYKRRKKFFLFNGYVSNKVMKDLGVGMDRDFYLLYLKFYFSVL